MRKPKNVQKIPHDWPRDSRTTLYMYDSLWSSGVTFCSFRAHIVPLEKCLNLGCIVLKHQLFGGLTMMCFFGIILSRYMGIMIHHCKDHEKYFCPSRQSSGESCRSPQHAGLACHFLCKTCQHHFGGGHFLGVLPTKAGREKRKHQTFEDDISIGGGFKDFWFSALTGEMMQFGWCFKEVETTN